MRILDFSKFSKIVIDFQVSCKIRMEVLRKTRKCSKNLISVRLIFTNSLLSLLLLFFLNYIILIII